MAILKTTLFLILCFHGFNIFGADAAISDEAADCSSASINDDSRRYSKDFLEANIGLAEENEDDEGKKTDTKR